MADSAYAVVTHYARKCTANLLIDDEVSAAEGVTDLSVYSSAGLKGELALGVFVDPA
ncbi:hypothetical protein ACWD4O_44025 [Streptomyces sp. NPDC002623]